MEIGIFSDIHDNLLTLGKALEVFEKKNIKTLIFCGDFCSPIPARTMGKYPGNIHCVFGNGDGDRFTIAKFSHNESPNLILHGEYADIVIDSKRIAITHYPFYGEALAKTGDYDAVFAGHTHEVETKYFGTCLFANPGEIIGAFGKPTLGIYNTSNNSINIIDLD